MRHEIDYSVPFRVRVIEDCRDNPDVKLDDQMGFCLGTYEFQDPIESPVRERHQILGGKPLIKTDSGYLIWGGDCWWTDIQPGG